MIHKITLNALGLLMFGFSFAQKPIYTKAKVHSVKVYRNSAELQNTASFIIPAGNSEVVIGNISDEIDEKTLQISFNSKNISILSSQFTNNYSSDFKLDTTNPQIKKVNDSIKIVESLITKNKIELDAHKKSIELLDKNQTVLVGSNSSSVAQLTQLTDFYTNKRIELDNKLVALSKKSEELNKQLSRLKNSLKTREEKEAEEFASGVLVLKLMSPTADNVKINLNYIANNVSWRPYYEIKGENIAQPLNITFKAIVNQDTGLDWRGVKLSLIDGNSYRNNNAPNVEPWFLNSYRPRAMMMEAKRQNSDKDTIDSKEIEEVVMVAYSKFSSSSNTLNTSYEAEIPYDILSNNEDHLISLYEKKIPAEYQYFTAPNYRKEAYLVAKVKDFSQYDLVNASASVIFENMYVGETRINTNPTDNELNITLGNDPKISIKRENVQDKSGEKFLSSYREKTITYDIVIKNNKKESIQIEVKDRYPLSSDESIKIELLEHSNSQKDNEKGILTWKLKLSPSETKKLRVSYKVRHPKDINIDL